MDRKEEFQVWNKVSRLYEEKFMNLDLYDSAYDFFIESLGNNSARVLDIGCGPGNISRYLLNRIPELNITGIDYAEEMIRLAEINVPEGQFRVMDCRDLSGFTQKFDGIVCGFILPYLSDSEMSQFLFRLGEMLNRNGVLLISFVEGRPESSGPVTGSTGDSLYFHYHNCQTVFNDLESNNLKVLKKFSFEYDRNRAASEFHSVIIAQKR